MSRTTAPTLYFRGNVWWFRFSHGGKQHFATTGETDRATAEVTANRIWLRDTQVIRAKDKTLNPLRDDPKDVFETMHENLLSLGRNPATIYGYRLYAIKYLEYFKSRPIGTLTKDLVEGWRDWLLALKRQDQGHRHKPLSAKYIREHLNWLAFVFNYFALPNPVKAVERPALAHSEEIERLHWFSRDEMRLLFSKCPDELRPAFTFLAFTGCRIGELLGLRNSPKDMDATKRIIWVTGKGSKRRQLNLTGPAAPAWTALKNEIKRRAVPPGGPIFEPYDRWADKRIRSLCAVCGIAARGPHTLRHTFASHALMYWGWDISVLAKWLGHESITVTYKIYGHLIPNQPPKIQY